MSSKAFHAALLLVGLVLVDRAEATVVGTSLVYQPAYLGDASQPDRIPLAPVICNSNHGYGSQTAIFQSRPCYHGHFHGNNGNPEYEQNLAVLFGISCDLSDTTQMSGCTATFHLKRTTPPPNAPYDQEQVFAASLQTLLIHSWGMSRQHPLSVAIVGDGIPRPKWAAKYEGSYFFPEQELKGKSPLNPLPVPGVEIDQTSLHGTTYLLLKGVTPDPRIKKRHPIFVPFNYEGEGDSGGLALLVPVWHGDTWDHPLGVIARPLMPYYEKWNGGASGAFHESEALPHLTPPNPVVAADRWSVESGDVGDQARVSNDQMTPAQFAVLAYACIASARPTENEPFTFCLDQVALPDEYREKLLNDPQWKDGRTCEFAIDPATIQLTRGSVPDFEMSYEYGSLRVSMIESAGKVLDGENPAPSWIAATLDQIRSNIPAIPRALFEEKTKDYRSKLGVDGSRTPIPQEERIRIMLAIWLHGDRPELFDALWWRSDDRVIRALAARLATLNPTSENTRRGDNYSRLINTNRFSNWECGLRGQELDSALQQQLGSAVEAWRKRSEAPPTPDPTE